MKEFHKRDKDKIEITKQQQAEIQTVLYSKIVPHENHILKENAIKTIKRDFNIQIL